MSILVKKVGKKSYYKIDERYKDEIKKMGAYFEKQKFIPAKQKYDKSLARKGDSQHENACDKCHTENGSSNEDDMPIIAGQWSLYTKYKLADFKEGLRSMPKKMKTALKKYHENTDIKDFDDLIKSLKKTSI